MRSSRPRPTAATRTGSRSAWTSSRARPPAASTASASPARSTATTHRRRSGTSGSPRATSGSCSTPEVRTLLEAVRAQSGELRGIAAPLDKVLGPAPSPRSRWARNRVVTWIRRIGAVVRLRKPVTAFVKHPPRSALYGDRMCRLTWGALNNMQRYERAAPAHFVFADSGIDLAVTATEFAGHERRRPALAAARVRRGPPARVSDPRRRVEAGSTRTSGCSRSPPAPRRRSRVRSPRSA